MEIWKDVPMYEGSYQASNLGNVRSLDRVIVEKNSNKTRNVKGRILKQQLNENNYYKTELSKNGKTITYKTHQIVAMAFLGYKRNGSTGLVVDHIDNNRQNNKLENLQLITQRENVNKDRYKTKKYSKFRGVTYCKRGKRFLSRIRIDGVQIHLGSFKKEIDAANAYKNKLEEYKRNNFEQY